MPKKQDASKHPASADRVQSESEKTGVTKEMREQPETTEAAPTDRAAMETTYIKTDKSR